MAQSAHSISVKKIETVQKAITSKKEGKGKDTQNWSKFLQTLQKQLKNKKPLHPKQHSKFKQIATHVGVTL